MNKKFIALSLLSSSLLLAGCAGVADTTPSKKPNEILERDDKHADLNTEVDGKKEKNDTRAVHFPDKIKLHYHNEDGNYDKKVWMWSPSAAPNREFDFVKDTDPWSVLLEIDARKEFNEKDVSFSFIVKNPGETNWAGKSNETLVTYKDFEFITEGDLTVLDLFITQSGSVVHVYPSKEQALADKIDVAFISDTYDKINVYTKDGTGNGKSLLKDIRIYKFNEHYFSFNPEQQKKYKNDYLLYQASDVNKETFAIKFDKKLPVNAKYVIDATFYDKPELVTSYTIMFDNLYNTPEFNSLNYDGDDLGAHVSADKKSTTFKVWAPTAVKMNLKVYNENADSTFLPLEQFQDQKAISAADSYKRYKMKLNLETAVWEITVPENLDGKYYTYQVYNSTGVHEVTDPYAISAGIKGRRSMIIDLDNPRAKPERWDELPLKWDGTERDIKTAQELSISEVHIRDLTMNKTWGGDKDLAGTFKGFIQSGTTYGGETGVKTGYDHLVEYGVNAIQLLPVFDFDNNERKVEDFVLNPANPDEKTQITSKTELAEYNWGYNPLNYNCVEGQYSSNPRDGYTRVKEYRELIQKFAENENKTRIIMDVVYNHVSSAPASNFENIMPKYYFRYVEDGGYADASGCGNEVKSEAPMMSKFIVDSLVHWATNYKVKGFRFDLMGCIDTNTLAKAAEALYAIDPDIVLYGEGWHAADPTLPMNLRGTTKNLHDKLGFTRPNAKGYVGGFNDGGRDAIKGKHDNPKGNEWNGFTLGGSWALDNVKRMVLGSNDYFGGSNINPKQNISYASCHDNFSLFDHLNWGLSNHEDEPNIKTVAHASVGVNSIVMMANTASFVQGGEELFRTKIETKPKEECNAQDLGYEFEMFGKRISHNAYKSSDETNAYDYSRKLENKEYFDMYKKLVEIKRNLAYSDKDVDFANGKSGDAVLIKEETGANKLCFERKGNNGKTYTVAFTTSVQNNFHIQGKVLFSSGLLDSSDGYKLDYRSVIITEK